MIYKFIYEFIYFMNSYMNSVVPRFQMAGQVSVSDQQASGYPVKVNFPLFPNQKHETVIHMSYMLFTAEPCQCANASGNDCQNA